MTRFTESIVEDAAKRYESEKDALLAFFNRIELSISTKLIDSEPDKDYFAYWLRRLITLDRHPDTKNVLRGVTPQHMVAKYIRAYGDPLPSVLLMKYFQVRKGGLPPQPN